LSFFCLVTPRLRVSLHRILSRPVALHRAVSRSHLLVSSPKHWFMILGKSSRSSVSSRVSFLLSFQFSGDAQNDHEFSLRKRLILSYGNLVVPHSRLVPISPVISLLTASHFAGLISPRLSTSLARCVALRHGLVYSCALCFLAAVLSLAQCCSFNH
jgi:hypothetical protein